MSQMLASRDMWCLQIVFLFWFSRQNDHWQLAHGMAMIVGWSAEGVHTISRYPNVAYGVLGVTTLLALRSKYSIIQMPTFLSLCCVYVVLKQRLKHHCMHYWPICLFYLYIHCSTKEAIVSSHNWTVSKWRGTTPENEYRFFYFFQFLAMWWAVWFRAGLHLLVKATWESNHLTHESRGLLTTCAATMKLLSNWILFVVVSMLWFKLCCCPLFQAMYARAEAKVKEMRQSVDLLKNETRKLEVCCMFFECVLHFLDISKVVSTKIFSWSEQWLCPILL